ncbi:MAG TPA: phosphoglycerate mutase, partial [Thermoplasmatales archaeon]|nr:phosphoglycerate mutase [Thermoplasmatales archaeon]
LISKVKAALEELDKGKDFVFIHFKGADSCAHDHDAKSKIEFIEKIDQALGYLLENVDLDDIHIAFTGDHSTPIEFGDHTADPVPIIIAGRNVTPDDVKRFSERSAMKGGLGRISGRVIPILFGYCDWLEKFGA